MGYFLQWLEKRLFQVLILFSYKMRTWGRIYKTMLIGEYTHTIDDKKRISMPSKFRKEVGKKVVVTRGLDNCLFLYPVNQWEIISSKLAEMGMAQADRRGFNRFFLSGAVEVDVDANGRILVPDHQREFANLKTRVVLTGVYDRIEIWDEKRWKEYKSQIEKRADMLAENLGEIGAF